MVLVMRGDLPAMTRGKGEGQACHAGLEAGVMLARQAPQLASRYLAEGQAKIVMEAEDLPALEKAQVIAGRRGVRCVFITDEGRTCFSEPTVTCALLGPMTKTQSNAITRGMKMRE